MRLEIYDKEMEPVVKIKLNYTVDGIVLDVIDEFEGVVEHLLKLTPEGLTIYQLYDAIGFKLDESKYLKVRRE